jgi:hypothetical protein
MNLTIEDIIAKQEVYVPCGYKHCQGGVFDPSVASYFQEVSISKDRAEKFRYRDELLAKHKPCCLATVSRNIVKILERGNAERGRYSCGRYQTCYQLDARHMVECTHVPHQTEKMAH